MMASRLSERIFSFRGPLDLLPFNMIQLSTNAGVSWTESSTGILGSGLFMSSVLSFVGANSFGGCPGGVPLREAKNLPFCFDEESYEEKLFISSKRCVVRDPGLQRTFYAQQAPP